MKVSVVIPAYNESRQIENVIKTAEGCHLISEVIVVDDGSTDKTAEIAIAVKAKVIRFEINRGKGAAMERGMKIAKGEIVLFLDADLVGLKKVHLESLIKPVLNSGADMTIADFRGGNWITFLGQTLSPAISGQRAIIKQKFENLNLEKVGYGAELALNKYAKKNRLKVKRVNIFGVNQMLAEQKMGFAGFEKRYTKYLEIIKQFIKD